MNINNKEEFKKTIEERYEINIKNKIKIYIELLKVKILKKCICYLEDIIIMMINIKNNELFKFYISIK